MQIVRPWRGTRSGTEAQRHGAANGADGGIDGAPARAADGAPIRAEGVLDLGALDELFRAHGRTVYAAALRVTGNEMDAEDALQTVFVRLLGKPRTAVPTPPGEADAYLRRAGVNAGLDVVRRRRPVEPLEGSAEASAPPATGDPALHERLRIALAGLSPRSAEMFALQAFEGMSQRELAALFGTSESAVGVTLHRARKRLRKEVAAFLGEDA